MIETRWKSDGQRPYRRGGPSFEAEEEELKFTVQA